VAGGGLAFLLRAEGTPAPNIRTYEHLLLFTRQLSQGSSRSQDNLDVAQEPHALLGFPFFSGPGIGPLPLDGHVL
jgi:hypothetical protein